MRGLAARYSLGVSRSEVASHCGEFCEVRLFGDTPCYGRLVRVGGDLFVLEGYDRGRRAVAAFGHSNVAAILSLPCPHF